MTSTTGGFFVFPLYHVPCILDPHYPKCNGLNDINGETRDRRPERLFAVAADRGEYRGQ
jgi:hypothetical protein